MTGLEHLKELVAAGQYATALRALNGRAIFDRLTGDLFRMELLERVGQHAEGRELAEQVSKRRGLSPDQKSTCEFVLGRIEWDAGNTDSSLFHFQRAVASVEPNCIRILGYVS